MNTATTPSDDFVRERLILWAVRHSKIRDLRLRGLAQELCSSYTAGEDGVTATHSELAQRLGVSTLSVWRYTQQLMECDEWTIVTIQGKATSYKPNFVDEAVGGQTSR
jgi:hypothetical protein